MFKVITKVTALAGVAQWIEHQPEVVGSIPRQGTCLGYAPGPQMEACERQQIDVSLTHQVFLSLSFSLPSPLSKNK